MQPVRTNRIVDSADFIREFGVSRETADRLTVYATLLAKWQKTINLVAPSTLPEVWHRHFADSAQVVRLALDVVSRPGLLVDEDEHKAAKLKAHFDAPHHWLDIGSGGGFPALVAAILLADRSLLDTIAAARPIHRYLAERWRFTLVESDQRKCAFLREVVRETGLKAVMPVDIVAERIERFANHSKVGFVDVVSARALAALPQLLAWSQPFFGPLTVGIYLKGRDAQAEVDAAKAAGNWHYRLVPSLTEAEARIVMVEKEFIDL